MIICVIIRADAEIARVLNNYPHMHMFFVTRMHIKEVVS